MINQVFLGENRLDSDKRILQAIRNLTFPALTYQTVKRGGFAGQKLSLSQPRSFKFASEWRLIGDDFADLAAQRQELAAICGQIVETGSQIFKLSKADGVDLQIEVKAVALSGDLSAADPLSANVLLELEAEYPYLQDQTEQVSELKIFNGGGMPIPTGIPLNMGVGGANEAILANNGNAPSYPIFTFIGPLQNPSLTNLATGQTFSLGLELTDSSQQVVVDTFNRTVVLSSSGVTVRGVASGDFWTLKAGNSAVHLAAGAYNTQGKCLISWRDHYWGI